MTNNQPNQPAPKLTGEQILDTLLARAGQPPHEPLQVAVSLGRPALAVLRHQLERDINAKARSWNPTGFTVLELLDLEVLLTRHPDCEPVAGGDNLLLTYPQLGLLATYTNRCYEKAIEYEQDLREHVLSDALDTLLSCSLLLNRTPLPLPQLPYGFFAQPHPLAVLWRRLRSLFTGRAQCELFYPAPPEAN